MLGIALLIMVTLPTVSSFSSGVPWQGLDVLLHLWLLSSSRAIFLVNDLPPLLSLVDGFSGEWLSLSL
jgi:hypothetical protein